MCGRTIGWGRLFFSAFSGNVGRTGDSDYREMQSRINRGHYRHNPTAFSIDVQPRKGKEDGYKTIWIKTTNGAYCVVKTLTSDSPSQEPEPAYVLLFSPDPTVLGRNFLYDQDKGFYLHDESKTSIHPISAYIEKDIALKPSRFGETARNDDWNKLPPHLDFSWVKRDIDKHSVEYDTNLRRHGILIEKGNTWCSTSSAFWLEEHTGNDESNSQEGEKKYHVYYHANPIHKGDGFLGKGALENPRLRAALKPLSMRLTSVPVAKGDAKEIVQRSFVQFVNAIIQRRHPYRIDISDYNEEGKNLRASKTHIFLKIPSLIACQKIFLGMASFHFRAFITSMAATGALVAANMLPAFLGLLPAPKSNILVSGPMALFRKASQFISPVEQAQIRPGGNIVERYATPGYEHFPMNGASLNLNAIYLPLMRPVDFHLLKDVFPKAKEFSQENELEWARNKIYDTAGHGVIFSKSIKYGAVWLRAWHPNGMKVHHDPKAGIAMAQIMHRPFPGSTLEKPVDHLFKTLKPWERVLCVMQGPEGDLHTIGLREHEPPPFSKVVSSAIDLTPSIDVEAFKQMQKREQSLREINGLQGITRGWVLSRFLSNAEPGRTSYSRGYMRSPVQMEPTPLCLSMPAPVRPAPVPA